MIIHDNHDKSTTIKVDDQLLYRWILVDDGGMITLLFNCNQQQVLVDLETAHPRVFSSFWSSRHLGPREGHPQTWQLKMVDKLFFKCEHQL